MHVIHPLQALQVLQAMQMLHRVPSSPNIDVDQHPGMDVTVELESASLFEGDRVDIPNCRANPKL
jgi:hypothetical protein